MSSRDRTILRDLVKNYLEICNKDVQKERRSLWRRHNSLKRTRPPIYVRAFAWREMPESECKCEDAFFRGYEDTLRQSLFRDTFDDDFIFEPWLTLHARFVTKGGTVWGIGPTYTRSEELRGSYVWDPPIKSEQDIELMVAPGHVIDEEDTAKNFSKLHDVVGDLITIDVDRGPLYVTWNGDISTQLARLRGLEQMMLDMLDRPEWLHRLLAFMRDGILCAHEEAEKAGDWKLSDHYNQAMAYAEELEDPAANSHPVQRKDLWYFSASQETTGVGPDLFNEFMLEYQRPILEKFGLLAYGCCEDLTRKIELLRRIPNLRRIAVSPMANVAQCAEQIGDDYIFSYRPSPTDMVGYGFSPDRIRSIMKADLEACKCCHVDITLKDVETVQYDPTRIRRWVRIVRELIEDFG